MTKLILPRTYLNQIYRDYLCKLDINLLIDNINNFRQNDLRNLERTQIIDLLTKVFFVPIGDGKRICALIPHTVKPPIGTILYRVRKNNINELNRIELFNKVGDFWAPPSSICKKGRINKDGESVLYVSFGSSDTIEECRLKKDDVFTLIRYETTKQFSLCHIGRPEFETENLDAKTKLDILYGFLEEILMTQIGENNAHYYNVTSVVSQDLIGGSNSDSNIGWAYPSTITKRKSNACIKGEYCRDVLKVNGFLVGKIISEKTGREPFAALIVGEIDDYGNITYHDIGSDRQTEMFPDLIKLPNY